MLKRELALSRFPVLRATALAVSTLAVSALAASALGGCGDPITIDGDTGVASDTAPMGDTGSFEDGGIGIDDLSIARVVPDHGPFTGGNTVILRGSGFTEEARVTFGGTAVQPPDHQLIDPRRLAVVVPAGAVGPVDVEVTVGDESFNLPDGYRYDALYVEPPRGALPGGTFVTITGSGTNFQDGDTVTFGRADCADVTVVSATRITCRTPPGAPGSVDVTVTDAEDGSETVGEDAYLYFDGSDPLAGGLGGGPIDGSVNVTVINAITGFPEPGVYTLFGSDMGTEHQGLTDSLGQITFSGPDVVAPATIHAAKDCFENTTFHWFDATEVTIFLVPWGVRPGSPMPPMRCGMGMPGGGGVPRNASVIEGELIWRGPNEMGPNPWLNIPEPVDGWVRVAYVYTTRVLPDRPNQISPDAGGEHHRVLETDEPGRFGYPYSIAARPAGLAVYALAGLENLTDGRFIPYVMGVARNVLAGPGETVEGVDVVMENPLDHYVETTMSELPPEVARGPDEYVLRANIDLGGEGFIVREHDGQELDVITAFSTSRPFRFVAQPALQGALSDGRYEISAGWFTSPDEAPPYTLAVEHGVTAVDSTLEIDGFLGIPVATAPPDGSTLPTDRMFRWAAEGPTPDFHFLFIVGADGQVAWTMYVNGETTELPVPNFAAIPELADIPDGFFVWGVTAVQVEGLDFDEISYEYLNDRFWRRSASDGFIAIN